MKRIKLVGFCMILASILITGCGKGESVISTKKEVSGFDFSKMTVGSCSTYIPLNIGGYPNANQGIIIRVVEEFRKKYPSLIINSWQIEFQPSGYVSAAYTYGIWVFHEPKKE